MENYEKIKNMIEYERKINPHGQKTWALNIFELINEELKQQEVNSEK